MDDTKIRQFMRLAGQRVPHQFEVADERTRMLGAQLLLSEVLEYVVHGLGVIPEFQGVGITEPNKLEYVAKEQPDKKEMLDGLADVAYTMYWNSVAFGMPLEQAFDLVCDNNLEKFVRLGEWDSGEGELEKSEWDCGLDVSWPDEVARVEVIKLKDGHYAVGKDSSGKVRKPSHYRSVDLEPLLS